jgi:6-phosphofructokinase 1
VKYFAEHRARLGFELRATILGHVQRGASPGAFDRLLASRLGHAAALRLQRGEHGVLLGLVEGAIAATPLAEVAATKKRLDVSDLDMARRLAR